MEPEFMMGTPNTLKRTTMVGKGFVCHWCGQERDRHYSYGGDRHWFCNIQCASAYFGWGTGKNRPYDYMEFS